MNKDIKRGGIMGNKIGIIYFSGTGNTKFVAQNMAKKLHQWGEEVDLINIEKDKPEETAQKIIDLYDFLKEKITQ